MMKQITPRNIQRKGKTKIKRDTKPVVLKRRLPMTADYKRPK